jgi:hypothetical protein
MWSAAAERSGDAALDEVLILENPKRRRAALASALQNLNTPLLSNS